MVTLLGGALVTLAVLAFSSIGIVFGWELLKTGSLEAAIERTTRRSLGVLAAGASAIVASLTIGVEMLLQAPEALITLLGMGSIFAGISWPVFGAVAFTVWIVSEAMAGGARA